ncbi:MAG: T9SS type A sorting domain-containing protein [Reichenbachiella sp.]|uniref:T9SS type A sorting domain-containing protein n=1 Tax=Reichenbachiella sp. TaxID=2184521 RepID=UPI00326656C4
MKRYITIFMLLASVHLYGQTVHSVTVAVRQGTGCPVISSIEKSPHFTISPNPTTEAFVIETSMSNAEARLVDMQGRIVSKSQLTRRMTEIDVRDIRPGIYVLHVVNERTSETIRIKIER